MCWTKQTRPIIVGEYHWRFPVSFLLISQSNLSCSVPINLHTYTMIFNILEIHEKTRIQTTTRINTTITFVMITLPLQEQPSLAVYLCSSCSFGSVVFLFKTRGIRNHYQYDCHHQRSSYSCNT